MIASQSRDPLREDLESWIESARGGDLLALGQAFQSLSEYLLLVANQEQDWKLAAKCDASDLVQETFLRAHRNFGGFRGRSAEEWRGWLRSILVNSLAEQRRRYRRTGSRRLQVDLALDAWEWPIASAQESPSRILMRQEREQAVMTVMARLPEDYGEVIIARHRDNLTHEQIGRRRGISAEAARKLGERAIGRLRQEVGSEDDWL